MKIYEIWNGWSYKEETHEIILAKWLQIDDGYDQPETLIWKDEIFQRQQKDVSYMLNHQALYI